MPKDSQADPHCRSCGADWTAGRYSKHCVECGAGALDISCPVCGGSCGARWTRAVHDSNDSGTAHFIGRCRSTAIRRGHGG